MIIIEELYLNLAKRNGWTYSSIDGRPYFMKDGKYAMPDETTTDEDKKLLASILSEGSPEMAELILLCWNNGIIISGPCSGIRKFHNKPPFSLHFSFKSSRDIIDPLYTDLQAIFPMFKHMYREDNNIIRYDIDYPLGEKELTVAESDEIFFILKSQLQVELDNLKNKKSIKV